MSSSLARSSRNAIDRVLNIADLFCGAGGTSTGAIEAGVELGYRPRVTGVNHWERATQTFALNHPEKYHRVLCTGVDDINPRDLYKPGELDLLWASPECTHHSNARGGKPINEQSRATAWCVLRWADALMPPVILVENVPEFLTWGGLCSKGRPLKQQKGKTFLAWVAGLESLGYRVDWQILCAADYGDPTTRKRLFVQSVRGRRKIAWPEPTHARVVNESDGQTKFFVNVRKPWVPAREIIDWSIPAPSIYERKRPLSEKTLNRIFEGLRKFGLREHLVCMEHNKGARSADDPMPTVTTARGGAIGIAKPFLVELRGTSAEQLKHSAKSIDAPVPTVTAGGGHVGVVEPFLVQVAHGNGGDTKADARRSRSVNEPLPTVCGQRGEWAFCEPALLPQQSGGELRSISEPAPTVATCGAIALVEPFLVSYYGTGNAASVDQPMETITTKDRFGLARPTVCHDGKVYRLDIGFRMLQPHELAAAQGFPTGYRFAGNKTEQVKQIGNAVPRGLARALVKAVLSL